MTVTVTGGDSDSDSPYPAPGEGLPVILVPRSHHRLHRMPPNEGSLEVFRQLFLDWGEKTNLKL